MARFHRHGSTQDSTQIPSPRCHKSCLVSSVWKWPVDYPVKRAVTKLGPQIACGMNIFLCEKSAPLWIVW